MWKLYSLNFFINCKDGPIKIAIRHVIICINRVEVMRNGPGRSLSQQMVQYLQTERTKRRRKKGRRSQHAENPVCIHSVKKR